MFNKMADGEIITDDTPMHTYTYVRMYIYNLHCLTSSANVESGMIFLKKLRIDLIRADL